MDYVNEQIFENQFVVHQEYYMHDLIHAPNISNIAINVIANEIKDKYI